PMRPQSAHWSQSTSGDLNRLMKAQRTVERQNGTLAIGKQPVASSGALPSVAARHDDNQTKSRSGDLQVLGQAADANFGKSTIAEKFVTHPPQKRCCGSP